MADLVPWIEPVKRSGQLSVYIHSTLGIKPWVEVFGKNQALEEFNRLSLEKSLNVSLIRSKELRGANVEIRTRSGPFTVTFGGTEDKIKVFSSTSLHGMTITFAVVRGKPEIEKAFIALPREPKVTLGVGRGKRTRVAGPGILLVIAVHEMVHACGLTNAEHTIDDLFFMPLAGSPHAGSTRERDWIQLGTIDKKLPPLILSDKTVERIRRLWISG